VKIALVLYPRFTGLDIIGPFQVLASVPGHDTVFVAADAGPVTDGTGRCPLTAGVSAGIDMALTLLLASMARSLRRLSSSPSNTTPPAPRRRITVQGTGPDGGLRAIIAHHAAVPAPPGGL
jgi:hypothetical protein